LIFPFINKKGGKNIVVYDYKFAAFVGLAVVAGERVELSLSAYGAD